MKCVIFCAGRGVRLSEKTSEIPKPLLEIGEKPIVERIMDHYVNYGVRDFVLCLGYLGNKISDYFNRKNTGYNVVTVDTGENSTKAERLMRVKNLLDYEFFVAYGDDLSNVDIEKLLEFHKKEKRISTLTAVKLPSAYGTLELHEYEPNLVSSFREKPLIREWINGGYFVFDKKIFDYISKDDELEKEVFSKLIKDRQLAAYRHAGFWKSMNTLKDHIELNDMFKRGELECVVSGGRKNEQ